MYNMCVYARIYIYIYPLEVWSYQGQKAVDPAPDRAGAVFHHILREGTRLVREDLSRRHFRV